MGKVSEMMREMRPGDIAPIAEMARRAWEMDAYADIGRESSFLYVKGLYDRGTFGWVYERDGKVLGCVIGRICNTISFPSDIMSTIRMVLSIRKKDGYRDMVEDERTIDRTDRELRSSCGKEFDGELVLLIVSEEARGMGLGKLLFEKATDEFKSRGAEEIFLYTDDDCGFGFYDRMGAERLNEKSVRLSNEDLLMMLYSFSL